jgi:predicted dehydrogenase
MIPEDRNRATQYMEQYDFQAEYVDDWQKAVTRDDIEIVHVCTINHQHYEQTLAAIEAGKHVVVEKPLCLTLEQLRRLVQSENQYKVRTHVGHVCRFYPAIVGLKNYLDSGNLGEVFYAESDYWHEIVGAWKVKIATGGSALLMGGCHSVDMVRWMIGEQHEAVEVSAFSRRAAWRSDFEYDPTIAMVIRFSNGALGRASTSLECNMPYVFHLQVNGTKGCIRNNGLYSEAFPQSSNFMSLRSTYPDDWNVQHHPFGDEVSYFVDCLENDRESMLSIGAAAKTYELIFAAELAAREHSVVKLPLG